MHIKTELIQVDKKYWKKGREEEAYPFQIVLENPQTPLKGICYEAMMVKQSQEMGWKGKEQELLFIQGGKNEEVEDSLGIKNLDFLHF